MLIIFSPFLIVFTFFEKASSVSLDDIVLSGPGLKPEHVVLSARYFDVWNKNNESLDRHLLDVSIQGSNDKHKPCRIWSQVLDRKDGTFIVRYKLYESCFNLEISVLYESNHVGGSPFFTKGPVYADDCNCPQNDIEKWLKLYGCERVHKQIQRDLEAFSSVNFNSFHNEAVKRFNNSHSSSVCHYVIKDNKVYRSCYGQHVGFKIFMDAILLSLTRKVYFPDLEFFSNLGDWPLIKKGETNVIPMFSWCGSEETHDILMPTYDITQATLEVMGSVSLDMLSVQGNIEKTWEQKENKAFWRGRDSNASRLKLIELSQKHPDLINASMTNFFFYRDKIEKYGPKVDHISFFRFFDYKYQLNIDGTVAAYRFPYLLAGDSLVFKQESKYYEHFYVDLQQWKHYVPIKTDLSDLVERLQWALKNVDKAREIAQEGQRYARENLLPQDIICYHANLFYEWSKKLVNPVTVRKGMEHVEQKNNKGCVCKQTERDEL